MTRTEQGRIVCLRLSHPAGGPTWCVGCGQRTDGDRWCSGTCRASHETDSGYDRTPDRHERPA